MFKLDVENERRPGERSIDPEDLKDATSLRDDSADTASAHMIAYLASPSHQHEPETFQFLEVALRYSGYAPPSLREGLAILAASFQFFSRNRPGLAEQWLAQAPSGIVFPEIRSTVENAIAMSRAKVPDFVFSSTAIDRKTTGH